VLTESPASYFLHSDSKAPYKQRTFFFLSVNI
jgi:hypothetical protein